LKEGGKKKKRKGRGALFPSPRCTFKKERKKKTWRRPEKNSKRGKAPLLFREKKGGPSGADFPLPKKEGRTASPCGKMKGGETTRSGAGRGGGREGGGRGRIMFFYQR